MDKNRRNFLKIMIIGGGVFVAGKVLGPVFSKFFNTSFGSSDLSSKNDFNSFKTVENKKGLTIYDKGGEEIFEIDNEK